MAEREGFEPSIPTRSITIFETVAFDHSAISPLMDIVIYINLQHFANFFLSIVDFFCSYMAMKIKRHAVRLLMPQKNYLY